MNASTASIDTIITLVASFHRVDRSALMARETSAMIAWPRHELAYVLRHLCRMTFYEIGCAMGGRDTTTIMHSIDRVEQRRANDADYDAQVADLMEMVVFRQEAEPAGPAPDLLRCIRAVLETETLSDAEARRAALAILPHTAPVNDGAEQKDT